MGLAATAMAAGQHDEPLLVAHGDVAGLRAVGIVGVEVLLLEDVPPATDVDGGPLHVVEVAGDFHGAPVAVRIALVGLHGCSVVWFADGGEPAGEEALAVCTLLVCRAVDLRGRHDDELRHDARLLVAGLNICGTNMVKKPSSNRTTARES